MRETVLHHFHLIHRHAIFVHYVGGVDWAEVAGTSLFTAKGNGGAPLSAFRPPLGLEFVRVTTLALQDGRVKFL